MGCEYTVRLAINTYTHTVYLNTGLNMPLLLSGSSHNGYNQAAAEVADPT